MSISFGMVLARLHFENENHYCFLVCAQRNPLLEDWDNQKVLGENGVLMVGVLVRYRLESFGMILARIHPHIREDFDTLITHIQSLFS